MGQLLAVSLSSLGYGTGAALLQPISLLCVLECGVSLVVWHCMTISVGECELEIPLAAVQVFLLC